MSDEPIVIEVRKQFVGAEPRRAAAADSGAIQSANVDSAEMPTVPIPIQARDRDVEWDHMGGVSLVGALATPRI